MKFLLINKVWYISLFVLIYSCADSQSLSGSKSQKANALFGEALRHYDVGEYSQALSKLDKALKKDSRFIQALDLQGQIHKQKQDIDAAILSYEAILTIDPTYKFAIFDLANIYFDKGDYDECENYLKGLKELTPYDQPLYNKYQLLKRNASFAKWAIKNPVPFEPKNLGPEVNSELEDYFPGLTLDESRLFFTRRDDKVRLHLQNEDLYISKQVDGVWQEAESIGEPVNTEQNEGAFTTSIDGKYVLFTACNRRGGKGSCDIWFTSQQGQKWKEPKNLGYPVNSVDWESQPSMGSDGVTLYFVSNRKGGYGGTDIWKSKFVGDGWSKPINLGPDINTAEDEQFPFIHPDGKTLYFTSSGHPGMGQSDIYFCKMTDGKWGKPQNIGYPINTPGEEWNFVVNRTGTKAYFSSNGIEDSYGGMDIYTFDLYEAARPNTVSYVKGLVFDSKSKLPLGSSIEVIDLSSGETVVSTRSDKIEGTFLATLPSNSNYALQVRREGYLFHSENFQLKSSTLEKPFELSVALQKVEVGMAMTLKNVFFDTDKASLLPESKSELQTLVNFLNNNPEVKVIIKGHTDNVGNDEHNLDLSKRRAKAVFEYLVGQGIATERLAHEGYGEKVPIATNETDEGRAANRRTEFEIIE